MSSWAKSWMRLTCSIWWFNMRQHLMLVDGIKMFVANRGWPPSDLNWSQLNRCGVDCNIFDWRDQHAILALPISRTAYHAWEKCIHTTPHWIALYCIVLHCIALHCIVLHCIVLYCTALYCTTLHCSKLNWIKLNCTASHVLLQVIVASYSGKILSFTAEPVLQRAQVHHTPTNWSPSPSLFVSIYLPCALHRCFCIRLRSYLIISMLFPSKCSGNNILHQSSPHRISSPLLHVLHQHFYSGLTKSYTVRMTITEEASKP